MLALLLCAAAAASAAPDSPTVTFRDAARDAGITFVHEMGQTGHRMMVETMGSGGGFIDFDDDGDLDIYLINGAPLPGWKGTGTPSNALYRNDGDVKFTDVTGPSGTGDTGYGQGLCVGDYDNDGFADLYVTNFGPNVLFHNLRDGTFERSTQDARVGGAEWSSSCAFLDYDADGDLDLFVVNYVDFTVENDKFCGDYPNNVKAYCHPNVYNSQADVLYSNNGDGTFTNVSEEAGLNAHLGNGLGIVTGDYDGDGDTDVYVANDKTNNFLWRNEGNGTFTEASLTAGVGYSVDGDTQAGMGTDFGDYNGDGRLDLIVTNLDFENNCLYRNEGGGMFSDVSFGAGLGAISLSFVGFGIDFLDYDNDGLVDVAVANGHILDNAQYFNDSTTYSQRNFLFHGTPDHRLEEVGLTAGPDMAKDNVARGLSSGDIDGDGDLDMLITVSGGTPRLFVNEGGDALGWVGLRLIGTRSNRSAVGARVTLQGPYGILTDEVRSGASYQSQSDLRLHFGLGAGKKDAPGPEITIRWPSGSTQTIALPATRRTYTILEAKGVIQ